MLRTHLAVGDGGGGGGAVVVAEVVDDEDEDVVEVDVLDDDDEVEDEEDDMVELVGMPRMQPRVVADDDDDPCRGTSIAAGAAAMANAAGIGDRKSVV